MEGGRRCVRRQIAHVVGADGLEQGEQAEEEDDDDDDDDSMMSEGEKQRRREKRRKKKRRDQAAKEGGQQEKVGGREGGPAVVRHGSHWLATHRCSTLPPPCTRHTCTSHSRADEMQLSHLKHCMAEG